MRALLVINTLLLISLVLEKIMSTPPVTRAVLDSKIDELKSSFSQMLTDLLKKIQDGTVVTPEDFSAEVASIQTVIDAAKANDSDTTNDPPTV